MATTIIDVAQKAQVSISTVSKYLNGGNVRDQNRKKIEKAIRDLNYHPNRAAQGLKGNHTFQIGLLINNLTMPYTANLTEQFVDYIDEKGYHTIIASHHDSKEQAEKALSLLINRQVDGIIYIPFGSKKPLSSMINTPIPLVAFDRIEPYPCDAVSSNGATAVYQAVEHLVHRGHRRIAILTGCESQTAVRFNAQNRLSGYLRALEDYMIPAEKELIIDGDFTTDSGYAGIEKLLQLDHLPTAVIVTNYYMVVGALRCFNMHRIRIPGEISFIAFDDMPLNRVFQPRITSIRQPTSKIVKSSVDLLLKRISGDYQSYPEILHFPCDLISRNSVKNLYQI